MRYLRYTVFKNVLTLIYIANHLLQAFLIDEVQGQKSQLGSIFTIEEERSTWMQ